MDLTPNGRFAVGGLALVVIGFGLAALAGTRLAPEAALPLIGGGATLLLLASRRSRHYEYDDDEDDRKKPHDDGPV